MGFWDAGAEIRVELVLIIRGGLGFHPQHLKQNRKGTGPQQAAAA